MDSLKYVCLGKVVLLFIYEYRRQLSWRKRIEYAPLGFDTRSLSPYLGAQSDGLKWTARIC
jgi:hypothetical protein